MQFDRAEPAMPAAPPVCSACSNILQGTYYSVHGHIHCSVCGERLTKGRGFDGGRFVKALLAGLGAGALAGGLNWFAAAHWDYYGGWLCFLGAVMVGFSIRVAGGGQGGWSTQLLALALTYGSVAAMFLPVVAKGEGELRATNVFKPLYIILEAPFIVGGRGISLWGILGVSLAIAWILNRPVKVDGPYPMGQAIPPGGQGGV